MRVDHNSDIDLVGLSITLAVMCVVTAIGISVMQTVSEAELERMKEVDTVCAGFFGCGTTMADIAYLFGIAILVVIVAVIVIHGHSQPVSTDDTSDSTDPVVALQEKYVDGEIQTEAQLERELEWYLYPEENGDDTDD